MEVYLIRHGESKGNVAGKLQGCQDFELTMKGKKQAVLLGKYLSSVKLDYLYSSDLIRAYTTAKAIEKHQSTRVMPQKQLREIYLGPVQGKTRQEIYQEFPELKNKDLLRSGMKGTETDKQITERCKNLYDLCRNLKAGKKLAVVSHGGFLPIFIMYLLSGEGWNTMPRPFRIDNTGITKLSWERGRLYIHYINRCPHLIYLNETLLT